MLDQPYQLSTKAPTIHLIYAVPDLTIPKKNWLTDSILQVKDPQRTGKVTINWQYAEPNRCLGTVQFADHTVHIAGLPNPLPQPIIDRTIMVSRWGAQIKAGMRQHQSHLSLVYAGKNPDPIEKMIALYRIAAGFASENLLGIVNEHAWTAHPPLDFLSPDRVASYRTTLPFNLWVGIVRLFIDKQDFWQVTKGHHIFDVPDLAQFYQDKQPTDSFAQQCINIFYYLYEQDAVIVPGDTLEVSGSGQVLKFFEIPEGLDLLMGPSGTLGFETLAPDEITR